MPKAGKQSRSASLGSAFDRRRARTGAGVGRVDVLCGFVFCCGWTGSGAAARVAVDQGRGDSDDAGWAVWVGDAVEQQADRDGGYSFDRLGCRSDRWIDEVGPFGVVVGDDC